ncbi:hypothetical protein [Streptomyces sp. NPDC002845]
MIRAFRVLPPLLLLPVLLTACGTEKVVVGSREPLPSPPGRAELDARIADLGVAPDLVYVTEPPGFALARQSVGVFGDDSFSSAYWSKESGAQIYLYVDRGTMTAESCPRQSVGPGTGERVTCERDGDTWYRTSAGRHEYAVAEEDHVVRISGDTALVARDVLRAAAASAHRPTDSELAYLLPPPSGDGPPVGRGDLPPEGDGAPRNEVGAGG